MDKPTAKELADLLYDYARDLRRWGLGTEEEPGEARLQCQDDTWGFLTGDSQYDQDHRGYWGSVSVTAKLTRQEARELAKDLIEQAEDHYAQCNG